MWLTELMEKFHAQWVRHSTFANELLRKFALHLQDIAATAASASSASLASSAAAGSAGVGQKLQAVVGLTRFAQAFFPFGPESVFVSCCSSFAAVAGGLSSRTSEMPVAPMLGEPEQDIGRFPFADRKLMCFSAGVERRPGRPSAVVAEPAVTGDEGRALGRPG
jgi:hypothetical protein